MTKNIKPLQKERPRTIPPDTRTHDVSRVKHCWSAWPVLRTSPACVHRQDTSGLLWSRVLALFKKSHSPFLRVLVFSIDSKHFTCKGGFFLAVEAFRLRYRGHSVTSWEPRDSSREIECEPLHFQEAKPAGWNLQGCRNKMEAEHLGEKFSMRQRQESCTLRPR